MARALGPHFMVLLRRHGATLVGKSMRECVFRSIYTTRNAELQLRAMAIGTPGPLTPGETEKTGGHNLGTRGIERAWEYWSVRLQKAEATWAASGLPMVTGKMAAARPRAAAGSAPSRAGAAQRQGEGGQAQVAAPRCTSLLIAGHRLPVPARLRRLYSGVPPPEAALRALA